MADMPSIPLDKLLKQSADGVSITVKVTPKSNRNEIKGVVDLSYDRIALVVRVCPSPTDGAANGAVIDLLADLFKVPRSYLEIKSGATSRIKTIDIKGDPSALRARIDKRF